ncbi:MAG: hypothetical protein RMI91_10360 [Gemmatales bacterium]|nr:hypothetical protein [Gemmatales bacterium]MDW7995044.1 hypothetical protein [Gemmatales bacterium]
MRCSSQARFLRVVSLDRAKANKVTLKNRNVATRVVVGVTAAFVVAVIAIGKEQNLLTVTEQLRQLATELYPADSDPGKLLRQAWPRSLQEQLGRANDRSTNAWKKIRSREDWEKFRQQKLRALRTALAIAEESPKPLQLRVTGQVRGPGYRVENLLYESRPGLWVSANLYRPEKPSPRPPGLLLVHSHHTPKWHSELQDMGILWARAGAVVLVPDLLGHGERRIHPFVDDKSYTEPFRPGRQDYYFRYNLGLQLYLLGETLMGWFVHDLRCGVSVLLEYAQADPKRLGILGSVAGGGDVAAVTAAVDERITAAVIFNFGGPEPEDPYPLPPGVGASFNYAGSGSWESTRNLIYSARDGFLPWVIVASIAPRGLCYAHEFSWDNERDPVWPRLQQVWRFYDAEAQLRFAHGKGVLTGKSPENTHCTHIGAVHRQAGVYQALHAWFGIPIPQQENNFRHSVDELTCWTAEARNALRPLSWEQWLPQWYRGCLDLLRTKPEALRPYDTKEEFENWAAQFYADSETWFTAEERRRQKFDAVEAVWYELVSVDKARIPCLCLLPVAPKPPYPCVVALCSQGQARLVRDRAEGLARLLERGIAVCLIELRDSGQLATSGLGRNTASNAHAASSLMLGLSVEQLRWFDVQAALFWLRREIDMSNKLKHPPPIDAGRLAVWAENLGPTNAPHSQLAVPWDAPQLPHMADPSAARIGLWLAVTDARLRAVYCAGDVACYARALESPFLYLPLAAVPPGILGRPWRVPRFESLRNARTVRLAAGADTPALVAHAPVSLRLEGMISPLNQPLDQAQLEAIFREALKQRQASKQPVCEICSSRSTPVAVADWLAGQLAH